MAEKQQDIQEMLLKKLSSNFGRIVRKLGVGNSPIFQGISLQNIGLGNMYTEVVVGTYDYRLTGDLIDSENRNLKFLAKYNFPRDKDRPKNLFGDRSSIESQEKKCLDFLRGIDYFLQPTYIRRMKNIRIFPFVGVDTAEKRLVGMHQDEKEQLTLEALRHIRKCHKLMNEKFERYMGKYGKIPDYMRRGADIGVNSSLDYLRALLGVEKIEELPEDIKEGWPRAYSPIGECFGDSLEIAHGDMHSANVIFGTGEYKGRVIFLGPKLTLVDEWFDVDGFLASHGLGFSPGHRERILETIVSEEAEQEYAPIGLRFKISPRKLKLNADTRQDFYSRSHRRVIDRSLRKLGKNADVRMRSPLTWENWLSNRPSSFAECDNNAKKTIHSTFTTLLEYPGIYNLDSAREDMLSEAFDILNKYRLLELSDKPDAAPSSEGIRGYCINQ